MLLAFLSGTILGAIGSVPLAGPIAVIVFHRGLQARYASGRAVALGSGLAEGAYAGFAYWTAGRLLHMSPWMLAASRGLMALVLLATGAAVLFSAARRCSVPVAQTNPDETGSFMLGLTIAAVNPALLLTWAGAVALLVGIGLESHAPYAAPLFGAGVGVGIVGWFSLLLAVMRRHKERLGPRLLLRVRQVLGAVVVLVGCAYAIRAVSDLVAGV